MSRYGSPGCLLLLPLIDLVYVRNLIVVEDWRMLSSGFQNWNIVVIFHIFWLHNIWVDLNKVPLAVFQWALPWVLVNHFLRRLYHKLVWSLWTHLLLHCIIQWFSWGWITLLLKLNLVERCLRLALTLRWLFMENREYLTLLFKTTGYLCCMHNWMFPWAGPIAWAWWSSWLTFCNRLRPVSRRALFSVRLAESVLRESTWL